MGQSMDGWVSGCREGVIQCGKGNRLISVGIM